MGVCSRRSAQASRSDDVANNLTRNIIFEQAQFAVRLDRVITNLRCQRVSISALPVRLIEHMSSSISHTKTDRGIKAAKSDTDALAVRRTSGKRARSPEEKAAVRQALIAAGRRAFAEQEYTKVSLRGIAAAAGYTPTVVYSYFEDRQALFMAVREEDLTQAIEHIGAATRGESDPSIRLRKLLLAMLKHWRAHFDQYELLFSGARHQSVARQSEGAAFGRSEVAIRSYQQYENAVRDFFDTLPRYPMPLKLATDSIVVAIHGAVAVPVHLETMKWSAGEKLAEVIADGFIAAWTAAAGKA
ncbi:MAG TPA: TetR/AcrR family transcriptional regulator [Paraburkholderia sp.]|nr:TetR/AcrR family transcriptional regulator [Paraburkholderia sp.]HKR41640.1 TetR/AcrR family transcriptional regulator [Paraburkholderia sp.]